MCGLSVLRLRISTALNIFMGSFVILFLLFCMFLQGRVQSGIMLIITLILAMGLAVLGYLLVEYAVYNGVYIKGQYLAAEYYGAAEPPVRCGESHLSGLTEPPHFFIKLLCHCWVQSIYFSHREVFSWVNTFNIDLIGIIRYAIHDGIGKSTFTITDLLVPLTFMELRTKDC